MGPAGRAGGGAGRAAHARAAAAARLQPVDRAPSSAGVHHSRQGQPVSARAVCTPSGQFYTRIDS